MSMSRGAKALGTAVKGIGIAGLATGIAAAGASMRNAASHFDRVAKISKQFGASTKMLQNLSKSAELAGTNLESIAAVQRKLIMSARQAGQGLQTQVRAMETLGLNAAEFLALNPDQKFLAFSKAVSQAGNDADKLAAALELGGRRAAEALPLLRDYEQVRKDINKEEALTRQQIQNIEALNDAWASLRQTATDTAGVTLSWLAELGRGLETTARRLTGIGETMENLEFRAQRGAAIRRRQAENEQKRQQTAREAQQKRIEAYWRAVDQTRRQRSQGFGGALGLHGAIAGVAVAREAAAAGSRPIFEREGGGRENFAPGNVFKEFPPPRQDNRPAWMRGDPYSRGPRRLRRPLVPGEKGYEDQEARARRSILSYGWRTRVSNRGNILSRSKRALAGRQDLGVQGAVGGLSGPSAFRSQREAAARMAREKAEAEKNRSPEETLLDIAMSNKDIADSVRPQ